MEPKTVAELMHRAQQIEGLTIRELANILKIELPFSLKYAKGFIGQLIEVALGASAEANPIQDFPNLKIELKTIPINYDGKATQTTHVCIFHHDTFGQSFENSNLYNKLKKILWVPIEGNTEIPFTERHIGRAFLWELKEDDLELIKQDWEEIMDFLTTNDITQLSAKIGNQMQIRPSGKIKGVPQYSFYLKTSFTNKILLEEFSK